MFMRLSLRHNNNALLFVNNERKGMEDTAQIE